MNKKPINKKEVLDYLYSLPIEDFTKIVKDYDKQHKTKLNEEVDKLYASEMEQRLFNVGVNSTCPHCHSALENTKFTWKAWVRIVEMTINDYSISRMVNVLEKDFGYVGIEDITIHLARHKILNAISLIPQPKLTGIIQIDETFFREAQKAAKELINYIPSVAEYRKPRYGVQPSLLGIMGSEFANVPVAVSSTGHIVAKVACMGRLSIEIFTDLFHDHIDNPAYICTDANPIYKRYCKLFGIPHYIRPSNYLDIIKEAGYDQPLYPDEELNNAISQENYKILEKLYANKLTDRIANKGYMTYREFHQLKKTYGLNLGAVNKQHSELKKLIYTKRTNVATKYLNRYVSLYVFLHNWYIDNGKYPSSTADAEEILIYILKTVSDSRFTLKDLREIKLTLPKPTRKYIDMLAAMTSEARKEFNNKYLKFNEEDKVYNFKKKEYLYDCPRAWLEEMAREKGIPYKHHTVPLHSLVNNLLKQDDIDIIIVRLLLKEKKIHIEQEDADLLEHFRLPIEDTTYNSPMDEDISRHYPPVREDSPLYNPTAYFTGQQLLDLEGGPDTTGIDDEEDDTLPF